jgi:O-antigen/teichoic acid export membrane protein
LKRDAYRFVLLSTAKVVLQYILILFFVVYLKFGLKGFYYGTFLALIPFVFLWFYLLIKNSILNYNSKQILSGLKFSFPLIPSSLAYVLLNSFDRFILEKYISISDLGLYNLANTLAFSLSIFISSAYKALEPEFFSRYADTDEFKLFVSQVKNQFYFILYFLAILLSLFSRDIIFNYAPVKFAETSNYIPMLLVSVLMTGHSIIYASILTSEKQTKIISFSILVGVILNVSLNFILIPIIGVYGAPVAAAFSYFGINLIYVFNIKTKPINFKNDFIGFFLFTILITALSFIEITSFYNYHFIYIKIIFFSLFVFYIANIFQINIRKLFKINFLNYN